MFSAGTCGDYAEALVVPRDWYFGCTLVACEGHGRSMSRPCWGFVGIIFGSSWFMFGSCQHARSRLGLGEVMGGVRSLGLDAALCL